VAVHNGSDGRAASLTFHGSSPFSTLALSTRPNGGDGHASVGPPPSAAARAYLRSRLPSIYQEDDFGLRFLGALEGALDPIVALLDCLPAHIDPDLAPRDILGLVAGWLGIELDEAWPQERWHQLVRNAGALSQKRGTLAGLELELRIAFPEVPLRVEDNGGVAFSTDPSEPPAELDGGFVVYCDVPLAERDAATLARSIEQLKPVGVPYRLRIKSQAKAGAKETPQ
jgi:phage tail-like protein